MKTAFNIFSVLILIVSSFAYFLNINLSNKVYLFIAMVQIVFFVKTGLQYKRDVFTSWANPIYVLLFSLVVVNYQTLANVSLGLGSLGDYMYGAGGYEYLINPCLAITVASMSCFMLAVINYRDKHYWNKDNYQYSEKIVNTLLLIAFAYFILTINIRDFLSGAVYHGSGASDAGVASYGYAERFLDSMIFIALAVYSHNIKIGETVNTLKGYLKKIPKVFFIVVGLYMILRLFSGDRGPVIYILFAILYSCMYCTRLKIKLITFLAVGIFGVVVMATLSYARAQSSDISFSEKMKIGNELLTATGVPNISPFTQELANSNICTLIMIDDINKGVTSYKYGSNAISVLLNCLPGMGIIKSIIRFPDFLDVKASTTYITESANGGTDYESGYGSTLIADYYYDWGLLGCLLGFVLLGIVYMRFASAIVFGRPMSVVSLIIMLKMTSLSIYIPRSTMWASVGSTVFILVIYFIADFIFRIRKGHYYGEKI